MLEKFAVYSRHKEEQLKRLADDNHDLRAKFDSLVKDVEQLKRKRSTRSSSVKVSISPVKPTSPQTDLRSISSSSSSPAGHQVKKVKSPKQPTYNVKLDVADTQLDIADVRQSRMC